jgi:VWFA-related protein
MTFRRLCAQIAALITAGAAVAVADTPQVFRSTTEVVLVDVLVREGSRPVRNLRAEDFIVYDSGAPQRIDQVSVEQLPLDLTLLLDTSGSTKAVAEQFRRGASRVAAMLGPDDRVRLMAFATEVAELSPLGRALPAPSAAIQPPSGGTSFYDALLLTMARRTDAGRRHLIVTFTDGEDTTSVSQPVDVTAGAKMSESAVHVVVPAEALGSGGTMPARFRSVNEAVEMTGGSITPLSGDAVDALKRIFEDLRQSYLLRYTPTWKSLPGWHSLTVRVTKPGVTVRARRGYYRS